MLKGILSLTVFSLLCTTAIAAENTADAPAPFKNFTINKEVNPQYFHSTSVSCDMDTLAKTLGLTSKADAKSIFDKINHAVKMQKDKLTPTLSSEDKKEWKSLPFACWSRLGTDGKPAAFDMGIRVSHSLMDTKGSRIMSSDGTDRPQSMKRYGVMVSVEPVTPDDSTLLMSSARWNGMAQSNMCAVKHFFDKKAQLPVIKHLVFERQQTLIGFSKDPC